MEFKIVQKEIELQSRGWIPTFHDIRREILDIVAASGIAKAADRAAMVDEMIAAVRRAWDDRHNKNV